MPDWRGLLCLLAGRRGRSWSLSTSAVHCTQTWYCAYSLSKSHTIDESCIQSCIQFSRFLCIFHKNKQSFYYQTTMYSQNTPIHHELTTTTSTCYKSTTMYKKRVRFATNSTFTSPGKLKFEELGDLWYQQKDLEAFKIQSSQDLNDIKMCKKDDCPLEMRGLECRTRERQQHKYMAIRCIISASRKGLNELQIATIAKTCNAWNRELAFLQGCHDFCDVYHPIIAKSIPKIASQKPPKFPFAMRKRPLRETETCQQRQVRQRIHATL